MVTGRGLAIRDLRSETNGQVTKQLFWTSTRPGLHRIERLRTFRAHAVSTYGGGKEAPRRTGEATLLLLRSFLVAQLFRFFVSSLRIDE